MRPKHAIFPSVYDRYTIFCPIEELEQKFSVKSQSPYKESYNAAPAQRLPVITNKKPGQIQYFHWGITDTMANNKSISPRLFNLSSDNALERPAYKKILHADRCLILANGFYVWKQLSKKQRVPYFCYYKYQLPFAIAGVWEEFDDLQGNVNSTFNMLVVPSSGPLQDYQEDMPAILTTEQAASWMHDDTNLSQLGEILDNIAPGSLKMHAVSPRLTDLKNNDEGLVKPAPPADQFGNYTLFS